MAGAQAGSNDRLCLAVVRFGAGNIIPTVIKDTQVVKGLAIVVVFDALRLLPDHEGLFEILLRGLVVPSLSQHGAKDFDAVRIVRMVLSEQFLSDSDSLAAEGLGLFERTLGRIHLGQVSEGLRVNVWSWTGCLCINLDGPSIGHFGPRVCAQRIVDAGQARQTTGIVRVPFTHSFAANLNHLLMDGLGQGEPSCLLVDDGQVVKCGGQGSSYGTLALFILGTSKDLYRVYEQRLGLHPVAPTRIEIGKVAQAQGVLRMAGAERGFPQVQCLAVQGLGLAPLRAIQVQIGQFVQACGNLNWVWSGGRLGRAYGLKEQGFGLVENSPLLVERS